MENKNSPARIRATRKYNNKTYDSVMLRVKKGNKEILQEYTKNNNISVNGLINRLLADAIGDDFKL